MAASSLEAGFRETVDRFGLFSPGQTVLVAVSGGPDSMALLHALSAVRLEWELRLVVGHLNHGFRGADAGADAAYVLAMAEALGLEARIDSVNVPEVRRRVGGSKQTVARDVRHRWLRAVAAEIGADRIALGHTRDDRVETVLLNLFRGTGTDGAAGFPPLDLPLVRPLYDVGRDQVEAYCKAYGLTPRIDSSNSDLSHSRNRTRAELLPYLRSYYNSRIDAALLRFADLVRSDADALDALSIAALDAIEPDRRPRRIRIPQAVLEGHPVAVRRRLVRMAIARVRGSLEGISYELVELAMRPVRDAQHTGFTLPGHGDETTRIHTDAEALLVERAPAPFCPTPWRAEVAVPGRVQIPRAGICVETAFCHSDSDVAAAQDRMQPSEGCGHWVLVSALAVTLPLEVRSWRPGDRIALRGGRRKLQDLFVDQHVPIERRGDVAVLTDSVGRILAVPGVAIAEPSEVNRTVEAAGWIAVAVRPFTGAGIAV